MKLSDRLESIIAMVPGCTAAADIGTDHGFVPIELVRRGIVKRAVASDVRKGPLERARQHIENAGLSDRIETRLGSGLETLVPGDEQVLILAGMGGILTAELLNNTPKVLKRAEALVLSPHTDWDAVRRCVRELGFRIADETMTEEDGKFYVVMKCVPGNRKRGYTKKELQYGPVLLRKRPEAFLHFLEKERVKTAALVQKLRDEYVAQNVLKDKERTLRMIDDILSAQNE